MRFVLFAFAFLSAIYSVAQSALSQNRVDLGDIYSNTQRYVDVSIRNPGNSKIYVLRIEQSPNVVYKLSEEIIPANGSITLRVQVNPVSKGKFELGCNVFMSDRNEPLTLTIAGNVVELPKSTFTTTACPDFNSTPKPNLPSSLTIITKDKETNELLSSSKVVIIRNGEPAGAWITGKKGSFDLSIPSGYFYFLATNEGYLDKEAGIYVGPDIREVIIPLRKNPDLVPDKVVVEPVPDTATALTIEQAEEIIEEHVAEQVAKDSIQAHPALSDLSEKNFDEQFFKPLNIEFVIDVSSSMKQEDKMELMKYALNQLVAQLRPVDRMGIVTYSDNAQVFQVPTPCDRKEIILKAVSELEPKGLTAGGRGIKLGYRELMLNYNPDKTNLVIIITDGAFNKDSDDYQKVVKKYARKGVIFSVVGVQPRKNDEIKMTEAATFGNGRYVSIHQLTDAQSKLFQEIRLASFKGTTH